MSVTSCTHRSGRYACGALLDIRVVDGHLVERCPACERRKAGVCRDCPRPVAGMIGRALRCAACTKEARRRADRKSAANNREKRRAANRRRWRASAKLRARKREQRRAWAKANPDAVKRHKRRYALKQTQGYRAGIARNNARPERAEAKRAQARQRYYELHPTRPAPMCAACERAISWKPLPGGRAGRPPKYHMECSPWKRQRKDFRRMLELGAIQEVA